MTGIIELICERCGHATPRYNLLEGARYITESSTKLKGLHYETLRRKKREGKIQGVFIERSTWFTLQELNELRTIMENMEKETSIDKSI